MKFNYKLYNGFLQPIINISIQGPSGTLEGIKVLVDSGATYSIFPESYALDIGLNLNKFSNRTIAFGKSDAIGKLGSIIYNINGYKFEDCAVFIKGLNFERNFSLLGRRQIFRKFKAVVFNERANSPYVYLNK